MDPAAVGAVVWSATATAVVTGAASLTPIQLFLLLGPLVVVPLGRPLLGRRVPAGSAAALTTAALLVVAALLAAPGSASTALTVPWLVATVALTARAAVAGWRQRTGTPSLADLLAVAAPAWLVVGALNLTASRAGAHPLGLAPELIELGAMHFSFAGFAATTFAVCVVRRSGHAGPAALAAVATVGGAAVVAVGHVTVRPLELAGAVAMTAGVVGLGLLAWSLAPRGSAARILLRVAAVAVVVPMALALHYAWALTTAGEHLPYETIARIHGTLNALGFSIGGLLGWRLLGRRAPAEGHASAAQDWLDAEPIR